MLCISFIAAVISCIFVFPDRQYLSYVDTDVIILLFCLMGAVAGFREAGIFHTFTDKLTSSGSSRRLAFLMMNICFFSSMLVTNDVALIMFVPLTVMIYSEKAGASDNKQNRQKSSRNLIFTVVIQTAAANLGSMLTPVGNPQNLFIYSKFSLTLKEFFEILLPLAVISYFLLCGLCLLVSNERFQAASVSKHPVNKRQTAGFLLIFIVCLGTVARVVPHIVCLIICTAGMLFLNPRVVKKIDYALLGTFVCFFVFVGNLGRIDVVRELIEKLITHREILVSAGLSQIISNVPAAVMLSQFTENVSALLMGVNIGGLGTLVASLASLISYKIYSKSENPHSGRYIAVFSAVNFSMLAVLGAVALVL